MEEKILFGLLTIYRERGNYLRRLEQFSKATASYDQAFQKFPDDVRLLIGRSIAASDAAKPLEAFENADAALKIEPRNMNARNVQARALYTLTEFERSLIMNFRGYRLRKQPPYFREGFNQLLDTIEETVGKRAGPVMIDLLPVIRRNLTAMQDEHEPVRQPHVSRIPRLEEHEKLTQMQIRKHQLMARVLAMKYLGPMAYDKFFLEALLHDRRMVSANSKGNAELKAINKEAYTSLAERQEMLRAQRPYYSIRYAEKTESKRQTEFKKKLLKREREINSRTAEHMIKLIEKAVENVEVMNVIAQAERMQIFLDTKTPHNFPERTAYVDRLYKNVGKAYYSMHRLSYRLSERGNRQRIAFLMGLPSGRPKSFDSVRARYPYKFIDLKDQIEKVTITLESCENSYMKCWLMYELASLLTKAKNYALAKFYAKRCQREARELQSSTWWLNACFVLLSGDMQQGNVNDVRVAVEEAYQYSKKLLDNVEVQAFLLKCLTVASEPISQEYSKMVRAREGQILKIMDEKSAVDSRVLFKRIATLPMGRRFKVLPGKPESLNMTCERKRLRHIGISVIPGKEKGLPPMPPSNVMGFQKFDI